MCMCQTPNVNGNPGYQWNTNGIGVHPTNPPELKESDVLVFDEPGRCGGQDSHSYHYRVIRNYGSLELLVRHGGGDERVRLSNGKALLPLLETLGDTRYWFLNATYHAYSAGESKGHGETTQAWRVAAIEKRIKVRNSKRLGTTVTIEPKIA